MSSKYTFDSIGMFNHFYRKALLEQPGYIPDYEKQWVFFEKELPYEEIGPSIVLSLTGAPRQLTQHQKEQLKQLVETEPLWTFESNAFFLYGLPGTRVELAKLIAE